jgi:hypothetical protein
MMNIAEYMPQHPLVVPVAVFGFLACLWILVVTISSRWSDGARGKDRMLRTWVDGKETTVVLPSARTKRTDGYAGLLVSAASPVGRSRLRL